MNTEKQLIKNTAFKGKWEAEQRKKQALNTNYANRKDKLLFDIFGRQSEYLTLRSEWRIMASRNLIIDNNSTHQTG